MSFQLKIKLSLFPALLSLLSPAFSQIKTEKSVNLTMGSTVYKKYCKVCHGDKGDGKTFVRNALKTPPADFTSPLTIETLSFRRMKMSILFGRPATAMVAWKDELSHEEIDSVVQYIRARFMKSNDKNTEPFEKSFEEVGKKHTLDLRNGKMLYQKHCYHCHGTKGDSRMPVNIGLKSPPRNFTDPRVKETLSEEQMFYSIRDGIFGTAMVSWKKEVSNEDILDIISYIRSGLMKKQHVLKQKITME
ncbi:MAG: c-type cytochrome [Nitrospinota bacterium]